MFDVLILQEAAADASTAAAKTVFGPMQMLEEGGVVTWTIAAILAIMSIVSWYIMLTKLFEQQKVLGQSKDAVKSFWSAPNVRDGANKLEKNSAFRQLVDDGLRADAEHGHFTDQLDSHEWMHSSLRRSQDAINAKLGTGLAFLATVGSTSPFVGLLGTVIGITGALVKIAATGNADIASIAGPVGEALYMTAFGLIVAVPAVMGYNWLQRRNKLIAERMSRFCDDLHGDLMSGGKIRPQVKAPAGAAKPAAATAKA
ncbi:MotA/TolQ/ExbB proton channel family protein [Aquisediminimonas profunda]|uniref:MotA/TolQ/ExbB proton channel family protein n=1 Tax=Aquisediminimonas profunda TaxID=1550733 RepID=UPI001C62E82C